HSALWWAFRFHCDWGRSHEKESSAPGPQSESRSGSCLLSEVIVLFGKVIHKIGKTTSYLVRFFCVENERQHFCWRSGRITRKTEPSPGRLEAVTRPPWRSTIRRHAA